MLNVLELLEMRKEIVNGILFIGIIYSVNYFLKSLIVKDENLDENLDENDIQLNELENDTVYSKVELENDTVYSKVELENKKEYLMNLNKKLMDIKHMLQDIKDKLNNK